MHMLHMQNGVQLTDTNILGKLVLVAKYVIKKFNYKNQRVNGRQVKVFKEK